MELRVGNIFIRIDPSVVNDPFPQTAEERLLFVKDAISHANMILGKGHGISIEGYIEDDDIRVIN